MTARCADEPTTDVQPNHDEVRASALRHCYRPQIRSAYVRAERLMASRHACLVGRATLVSRRLSPPHSSSSPAGCATRVPLELRLRDRQVEAKLDEKDTIAPVVIALAINERERALAIARPHAAGCSLRARARRCTAPAPRLQLCALRRSDTRALARDSRTRAYRRRAPGP